MATVPRVEGQSVTQRALPDTTSRAVASAEAFGAGAGRATEELGGTIGGLGLAIEKRATEIKAEDDDRQARDLSLAFSREMRGQLLGDGENPGYYDNKGQDAISNYEGARKNLQDLKKKYVEMGGNPTIKEILGNELSGQIDSEENSLARYVAKERQTAAVTSAQASQAEGTDFAASYYNDKERLAFGENKARASAEEIGLRSGLKGEALNLFVDEEMGKSYETIIDAMLTNDPDIASEYFRGKQEDISSDRRKVISKKIKTRKKEIDTELELAEKKAKVMLNEKANKELTDLAADGNLSWNAIHARDAALGASDKERWRKTYEATEKAKKEATGKSEDKPEVKRGFEVEAMSMGPSTTEEEVEGLKQRISLAVAEENLTTETARKIITDSNNSRKVGEVRKAEETGTMKLIARDFEDGGILEDFDARQRLDIEAFVLKASRDFPEKQVRKIYDEILEPIEEETVVKWFGVVPIPGEPTVKKERIAPLERIQEIEFDPEAIAAGISERDVAIQILEDAGQPTTEANITFIMEQR